MTASVVVEYQGDTTSFTPGINSVNAFGEATATKAGVTTKADKSKSTIIRPLDIPKIIEDQAGRPIVIHNINKSELASATSDSVRRGKSREQAWTEQLDLAIGDSFRRGAKQYLIPKHGSRLWRQYEYGLMSFYVGTEMLDVAQAHPSFAVPAFYGTLQALVIGSQALFAKNITGETKLGDRRWSAFWGQHQSDRYWALSGLSRVSKLARYRE